MYTGTLQIHSIVLYFFFIALMVEGYESSWLKMANFVAGGFGRLLALNDSPAYFAYKYSSFFAAQY